MPHYVVLVSLLFLVGCATHSTQEDKSIGVHNVAHRLIEEFMLAANEAVAEEAALRQAAGHLSRPRPARPGPAGGPARDSRELRVQTEGGPRGARPVEFQRLLGEIEGKPEERLLHDLLLRAQRKALYAEECRGHYALAAPYYCHFTSPIRRYPDLVVHRQLSRLVAEGRPIAAKDFEALNERLREVSIFCSERERRAEQAERESLLWKKIVFMRDKVGREFDAYVTGVASFGVFVTLKDFFVEGLVPMSALGNDFFVYEEKQHRLRGRSSGKTYRLGDSIRVRAGRDRRGAAAPRLSTRWRASARPRRRRPKPDRAKPMTYGRRARRRNP